MFIYDIIHHTLSSYIIIYHYSGIQLDSEQIKRDGILLESLDLRDAYYSAQKKCDNTTQKAIQEMDNIALNSNEDPCHKLVYQYKNIFKMNVLCVSKFYYDNELYIVSGTANRELQLLSTKGIFSDSINETKDDNKNNDDCKDRLIKSFTELSGPPLYINVDPKFDRYLVCGCMDGSIYLIDMHSAFNGNKEWKYKKYSDHKKYVVMCKFCYDSKYLISISHDYTLNLYKTASFDNNSNNISGSLKFLISLKFKGALEAIDWLCDTYEFVLGVRNDNYLYYYNVNELHSQKPFKPYIKCNINAFNDDHLSYSIGFLKSIKINNNIFILCKTSQEKILLFLKNTDDHVRIYYGSYSDNYTYTRCFFSFDQKYIYSSHLNDLIIWDIITQKIVSRINAHKNTLRDMILDNKKQIIITCSFDKTVKIWAQ